MIRELTSPPSSVAKYALLLDSVLKSVAIITLEEKRKSILLVVIKIGSLCLQNLPEHH